MYSSHFCSDIHILSLFHSEHQVPHSVILVFAPFLPLALSIVLIIDISSPFYSKQMSSY